MTPAGILARARILVATTAIVRALLLGLSAGALTTVALALTGLDAAFVPALVAIAFAVAIAWRGRAAFSRSRIPLWVEEKLPGLEYAFVTAVDPGVTASPQLREHIREDAIHLATRRAALRALVIPAAVAALSVGLSALGNATEFVESRPLLRLAPGRSAGQAAPFALSPLRVTVSPPAYTRQGDVLLRDPLTVSALARSTVTVSGPGRGASVQARYASANLAVRPTDDGWVLRFTVGDEPAALTLASGDSVRHVVVDPRADESPTVTLLTPVRDTTLRQPRLRVSLDARLRDDVGLARGYFEYLISSGSGESFTGRVVTTPVRAFGGQGRGALRETIDIGDLKLAGGDVVSMRAVAFDGNTLTGPSMGSSETRTIRIARADEYDSISVDAAAPPPVDSSAMSQRMLITMTEELVRRKRRLPRVQFVEKAVDIGHAEDRIRKRVYDLLYESDTPRESDEHEEETEHEHSEVRMNPNRDLKQAYDALWDAVRALQIAEPERALPPMRVALKALDRARLAQRLYLRGRPPRIVVDIGRVRLSGKDKGVSSSRSPAQARDSAALAARIRLSSALEALPARPAEAAARLSLLRADVLRTLPDFAAAIESAVADIRAKRDPSSSVARARRSLQRSLASPAASSSWVGG